jgi:glucose-6-phosphate 1-dehydrogenase
VLANPLRDPRDHRLPRIPQPCALVVFGVTGDLSRRRLLPAVFDLANRGLTAPEMAVVGFGRRSWSDSEFAAWAREHARNGARTAWREGTWSALAANMRFVGGTFDEPEAYAQVDQVLADLRGAHGGAGNAAFYLSVAPDQMPTVLEGLAGAGLGATGDGWRRIVLEKPFGSDLRSARALHAAVERAFDPRDIFRIDHYLGKETVQNLFAIRFANTVVEPTWNRNYVDSVQITMAEDLGVGTRAGSYDGTGALRDVVQNHLLQLLALTAMEDPNGYDAADLREEKAKVLRAVVVPDVGEAALQESVMAQYGPGWLAGCPVPGYRDEPDVPAESITDTYAALRLSVENRRWAGVPFYLRAGKRLPRRVSEIAVVYRRAPYLPFLPTDTSQLGHNSLVIRVQPDEGVTLTLGSKVPGSRMAVRDVTLDFSYTQEFTEGSPEAYERLILDVLLGDGTLFPTDAEVEAAWSIVDPIVETWHGRQPARYPAGTWGPTQGEELLSRDGRSWRQP